jgi:quinoprotein glucose dehydrogenase
MDSGKVRWTQPFGQSRRYGVTFPKSWGSVIIGGPMVTAGGIIVMAASMDKKLRILDIATGEELWQDKLPYAGMAVPMTYMANGKQFIVIAAGGNRRAFTEEGDAIVAYWLKDD